MQAHQVFEYAKGNKILFKMLNGNNVNNLNKHAYEKL